MFKPITTAAALTLFAYAVPGGASERAMLEGRWINPHHTVVVNVARCGEAYCGTVSWATARNREHGTTPGTRVLSDLRPAGDGTFKGSAYEPRRGMHGSAIVRQEGSNVMIVKGCALFGLFCKEQRWTRVS